MICFSRHVSPALIQIEAQVIANATDKGLWDDGGEMSVRASANSRQASARTMEIFTFCLLLLLWLLLLFLFYVLLCLAQIHSAISFHLD